MRGRDSAAVWICGGTRASRRREGRRRIGGHVGRVESGAAGMGGARARAPRQHRKTRAGARGRRSPPARGAGTLSRVPRSPHRDVSRAGAGTLAACRRRGVGWGTLGRRGSAHRHCRYPGAAGAPVLRVSGPRRAPSQRSVAAVREVPADAGRTPCLCRRGGRSGALLSWSGAKCDRVVPADSRGRDDASLPRAEDSRIALRPRRPRGAAAVRGAARGRSHRRGRRPVRSDASARRRAEAHGQGGAKQQVPRSGRAEGASGAR